jgi:sugar phosphate permease
LSSGYRWLILAIGVLAQSALASFHQGLPAVGPALQHCFAVSLVQTGALFSAIALGIAASLAAWGILADRFGERAVLAAGLLGAAAALAVAALARGYGATFVALVAAGLLGACANAASGRAVMAWFTARERGLALGIRQMATPLGGGLAALALPLAAAHWGVPGAFWVLSAFCALASLACGLGLRRSPWERKAGAAAGRSPLLDRRLWRLATGGAMIVAGQLSLVSYLVLFLSGERHWALTAAAAVLTASQFLGAGARVGAGVWSDRLGERIRPMRWLALGGAGLLALSALLVDAPIAFLVPVLLLTTVVNMSTNGLAFTATGELAGVDRAGAAMGFQNTFLFVSGTVAPVAFGAAVTWLGWRFGFAVLAAAGLGGWLLLAPLTAIERAGWRATAA